MENVDACHLETTAWQWLQDSCSFFHKFPLTLLLLLLLLEQNSGLDCCQEQNYEAKHFPCQTYRACPASSRVWCTHVLDGVRLGHKRVWPLQAEPPAWTAGGLPTLCFERRFPAFPCAQHGTAASASPALCFWVAGFHPRKSSKETREAVRQESGRREFLINSFSWTTFLFETAPIPVFITMHFSFDKCLFHFI